MKKIILYAVVLITAVNSAFAQKDARAKVILGQVSQKYRSYDAVKTDFTFTLNNQQAGIKDTQTGSLIARSKANKFKVTIYSPENTAKASVAQEIISDGKTQWTYLKKDNEVQVNNVDHSGDGLNPAQIFTMYEHGYKYIYNGDTKVAGKVYQEVDLTPEDDKKSYFKIRLLIDKAKKQIYSALIFEKNGNRYSYTIKGFTPNVKVPESTFTFDPKAHKGVEVVDLR
ncbi:LolA-like putative outer membrane lipoprotein chaperone [soil metagenome]|jgi:outer membrane lipoprotein-sorting protein